ncbi:MAG: CVNH domain-containing protein [Rhizonema sp. PD37]|nr:CVNH domain-containing protein [Rhizonema sp. PD37]
MSKKANRSLSQGLITLAAFSGLMATSYVNVPSASAAISSFQSSCRNISISGDTLSASCRRVNGTFNNKASIRIRGIKNNNGNLMFIGLNNASSFQSSCRNISITGDTLSASCRRVNGTFSNSASILLRDIKNNNGNLTY